MATWQTQKNAAEVVAFQLLFFFPLALPVYFWLKKREHRYLQAFQANLGEGWVAQSATSPGAFTWWVQPVEYRPFAKSALGFAESLSSIIVIVALGFPLFGLWVLPVALSLAPMFVRDRPDMLFFTSAIWAAIVVGIGWFPFVMSATWLANCFHAVSEMFRQSRRG